MSRAAPAIRDSDLLAELEGARGKAGYDFVRQSLELRQADRDRCAALRPGARRRLAVRRNLEAAPASFEDLRHIHSVLAVCGLPYTRQPIEVREYQRRQGRMSLVVEAGKLLNPHTGTWEPQELPSGPKARLLTMHFCSEAVRQKSPTIDVADSLTGFIRDMGFAVTGGKRGTIDAFKRQVNALAACKLTVGMWDAHRAASYQGTPFASIDMWLPLNPDQLMLWPSSLTLSQDFYQSLSRHALPIRAEAVRAFAGSARKLDMVMWLNYRLYSLRQSAMISWSALALQFGGDFHRQRAFRAQFADDLADIKEVFPKLPARLTGAGLQLSPAGPDVLALPPKRRS